MMTTESATTAHDSRVGSAWLARASADERNALLVALLSRFNHDLRTPLNTAVGWTHLMQQGAVDSARARHVADVLARATREQTLLLDEFIDDARSITGVLKIDAAPLPVNEIIARALERAAPVLSLQGTSAEHAPLPGDASVNGDERRSTRLVYRLLAAVAQRAREGTAVDVAAARHPDRVQLRISAATKGGDWSEPQLLDLRISAYIVALHRGELRAHRDGERATLVLELPAHR
jgi:signal transduction histidine kinase